jgi:AcrR family transcriptional regulator
MIVGPRKTTRNPARRRRKERRLRTPDQTTERRSRRRSPPEVLLRTAERVLATNGFETVSLRQIASEAGLRNPAAVQYHFGSREGLFKAIIEYRNPPINRHRLRLLEMLRDEGREHEVRGLVEAMARPLLGLDPESYYVEFLAQLEARPELESALGVEYSLSEPSEVLTSITDLNHQLETALSELPLPVCQHRIRIAAKLVLSTISDRRFRFRAGIRPLLSDEGFAHDLFDVIVGLLCADHTAVSQ